MQLLLFLQFPYLHGQKLLTIKTTESRLWYYWQRNAVIRGPQACEEVHLSDARTAGRPGRGREITD